MKLDEGVQLRIIDYITLMQNDMDAQKELEELMNMISPSLKNMVT